MKKFAIKTVALVALITISACAGNKNMIDKAYYSQRSPKLDMQKYFDGTVEGYGFVQDGSGKIAKTFSVKVKGEWEDNKGIVKEYFTFDDNKKDSVIWIITVNPDNSISAIAHDILGSIKGGQYGSAADLSYVSNKMINGIEDKVKIYDTFFAINSESLVKMSYSKDLKTTTFYKKLGGKTQSQDVVEKSAPVIPAVKEEIVVAKPVISPETPKPAVPTLPSTVAAPASN